MATKKKATKNPRKYLYAAVLQCGDIAAFAPKMGCVGHTAREARDSASSAGHSPSRFRVVRYVLESSIRPGGR